MKVYTMAQGSEEWQLVRLGTPTASKFKAIMTSPPSWGFGAWRMDQLKDKLDEYGEMWDEDMKKADLVALCNECADRENPNRLSDTANTYASELIAELFLEQHRAIHGKALEWGKQEEPKAALDYAMFDAEEPVEEIGFVTLDDGSAGASPDLFVGDRGGVEIKSPENPGIHISTIRRGTIPDEHIPQVQGGLWICEREWWDFISFRNDMPPHLRRFTVRVYRDEEYIRELSQRVRRFSDIVAEEFDKLSVAPAQGRAAA